MAKIDQVEVNRISSVIMEGMGECDLEAALMVLANISGQLIAHLSEGRLNELNHGISIMAVNMKRSGNQFLIAKAEEAKQEDPA